MPEYTNTEAENVLVEYFYLSFKVMSSSNYSQLGLIVDRFCSTF